MTAHRLINWAMAALIVVIFFGLCAIADAPSDHSTEMAQAADLQAAIQTEAAQSRFDRAAAAMCGNADWALQSDNSVRCLPRKGHSKGAVLVVTRMGAVVGAL